MINENFISISRHDLRALVHWAEYGVGKAYGGSYRKDIQSIISYFSRECGIVRNAEWGKYIPSHKKLKRKK